MKQYLAIKEAHPREVLFFRMGDFYEMFFEDAEIASRELELTLTARNKQNPDPVPMAGVPHHAAAGYIERLVAAGYRVAIAEQVEDPRKAKGLVKRAVVRVVTPGVALNPTTLEGRAPCFLVSVKREGGQFGLAFLDTSTGDFRCTTVEGVSAAAHEIARMEPREALVGPSTLEPMLADALHGIARSELESEAWSRTESHRELAEALGLHDTRGLGIRQDDPSLCAAGAVLRYARDSLGTALANVHTLRPYHTGGFMVIDQTTRRNLELTRTLIGGRRKGSLLHLVDRTGTAPGSRLLRDWLVFPLLDVATILARQDAIQALITDSVNRDDLRQALRGVADIQRIGARIGHNTAHARDLAALKRSLAAAPAIAHHARQMPGLQSHVPADVCADISEDLNLWLIDEPPISVTEGGLLNPEAHAELSELARLSFEGVGIIAKLEAQEQAETGITSLKIRKNRVFGYYIEVTKAHVHKVPERYLRKQTLSNCERYITAELKELEERVLGADERRKGLEYELFSELRTRVGAHLERLLTLATKLASLDVLCALADCAVRYRWVRPHVEDSTQLHIVAGRHPVVEASMVEERFVPNDIDLNTSDRQLIVLTGPNMSGKSTIMRQVALIALLAQVGSFVPAESATVGLADRIFTRVGAADDLARGQSTFMVEMAETAAILHQATGRSLIILDEIGRGTSTYDGLSIAWAVAEDLVDRLSCRALFATHYHELCELAETRAGVVNQSIAVSESGEEIVFLRRLKEGGASRSYGIQCARIAGIPDHVIDRARRLLTRFEKHAPRNEREQLSLFGAIQAPSVVDLEAPAPTPIDPVRTALEKLDPDSMSPREALNALYDLRTQLRS
ncbi:MAG: DNA mismatch repair protein MutS [Rhodobacterales bacterium]|nr:DNA mismatch repair protein MutS [Rhodobacterales bacterium]